jgi:hypothetical protein
MTRLWLLALLACSKPKPDSVSERPLRELPTIAPTELCVTRGKVPADGHVSEPTVRAVAIKTTGDAAALQFTYRGSSEKTNELASGQTRHQLGLKLRAEDGCNLVYVMWRTDTQKLDVSVKLNPGKTTHAECGAAGYTKIKATKSIAVPALESGGSHTLQAEIVDSDLFAWVDGKAVWQGRLPDAVRLLAGASGFRSDNVIFDLVRFGADPGETGTKAKCVDSDD